MKFETRNRKAGVSLVTVLLFMLVATIAATATYKWLTSEGRSSGSRMQKQMAYQSAVAGIENARAWMTFHANDVGALVKQYMDGNYVPINLDANLRSLQRPGQNHHVWLVGVNTSGSTYKLKILSSGEANGGAKHSEIAILNVSGLYQVSLPQQEHPKKKIPFDYAYFGGSYDGAGSLTMTSAIVNGNWYGNPQGIEKKFVVTGNADLTGNDVKIGELACVGGNMNPENQGLQGKDIYVGKNFTGNMGHLSGNAYFDGDVNPSSAGEFKIDGNVTLNGNLQTVQSAKNMTFEGNLCLDENAHILSKGTNYTFSAKGDIWMPGTKNLWYGSLKYSGCTCKREQCSWMGCHTTTAPCTGAGKYWEAGGWATYTLISCTDTTMESGGDNYEKYNKIVLGSEGKTVYMRTGYSWSEYSTMVTNKTFTETKDEIIKCNTKPGVMAPDMNHAYCDNGHDGKVGSAERWNDDEYSPYPEKASKDKLYYSYYLEPGHNDVTLTSITDPYWIWCNKWEHNTFGWQYCSDATEGVEMLAYHVDGERFWDGFEGHARKRLNYENGKPTGSPYCTDQTGLGPGNERKRFRPKCGVTPWFKVDGSLNRNIESSTKIECAEAVKDSCDAIWEKKPGCDGSSYKVDDVLVTAKTMFEPYASKGCAASITRYSTDLVTKLNACYEENNNDATKKENNLYNGYLVVKVSGGTNSTNPSGTLNGKFIIIAKDALYTKLPQTSATTSVLLYLEKGANTLNDVTVSNYFIYTEGNIGSGNQFNLNGTIYATAESCAGLGKLQSSSITYNQDLVNELSTSGVICPNDGSICGGTGGSGSGTGASGSGSGTTEEEITTTSSTDAYYISMAPQLGVTLESQYENNEPIPTAANQANLSPSFIVLPRIVYLPSDPFGALQDYYNVLPLNGSTLKKSDVSISSCVGASGSIPSSGKLFSGTVLSKGIYTCTAKAGGYSDVPFWVVVGDAHRGSLPITFVETEQKITAGGSKTVNVSVPPNTPSITLSVYCPNEDDHWHYTLESSGEKADGTTTCTFPIQGDASTNKIVPLFTVTTDAEATHGSITFQLLSGMDYNIGSPYTSQVYMASSATLERISATSEDIADYCNDHPSNCPPEGKRSDSEWPNCETTDTWVEPTGITYGTEIKNNRWNLVVGGSGTLQFVGHDLANCVAIVPTTNNSYDVSTINADDTKQLRASLKALKRTVKVTFVGQITDDPVISIDVDGVSTSCKYSESGDDKSCYITAFSGQQVTLSVNKTEFPKFNYWDCSGESCPVTEAISSATYNGFTIKDNNTVVYAHFNEADKHCFFDEFKSGTVQCSSEETEYCIDNCGTADDATCTGAIDATGVFSKSKWHLTSGKLSDIDVYAGNISLHRQGRSTADPVTVISTVNAGTYGTLKALFQLPKETSSHNRNSQEISKSGFLLHSNVTGSEYLMLNVFAGQTGNLEAQLCSNSGKCLNATFMDANSNTASVYASSMVMMSATMGVDGKLSVAAFTGNYYGNPTEYDVVFNLDDTETSYSNVAHEFVGFSLADANFKLYGIGWKSDTYSAECHDTYPIVKCSFAAVATDGVIPTETYVKPWIGHSGWYDSKTYSCTEKFYYTGADACAGSATTETLCPSNGYNFKTNGLHGYKEGTVDVKTAKAWLECSLNAEETPWTAATKNDRAHCGTFWTGKIQECSDHVTISDADNLTLSASLETPAVLTTPANLRATSLAIEFAEASGIDVEIWLMSKNENWGAQDFASKSVITNTKKASFSVDDAMTVGAEGFDPEKVTQIVFKNRGSYALTVKSVVASCKNAVDINGCTANFADGKWDILIDVNNKDKIASYGVDAKVDGSTVFDTSSTSPIQESEKIKFEKADNPYAQYQGKSYNISASIVNKTGSTASKSCTVTPSIIGSVTSSCKVTGSPKKQGAGLPQFNITLSGCPTGGCPYEVYIGDAMLDGYPQNGNGSIDVTPDGNGNTPSGQSQATADYAVGSYTYKVKSPVNSDYPFTECTAAFEIQEKSSGNENDVRTECKFDNPSINQPGAQATFRFSVHEKGIDICNRKYKLMLGTDSIAGGTTSCGSNQPVNIQGTLTAQSESYVLYVMDDDDEYQQSCTASLTVADIGLSCSNNGNFHVEVSNPCVNNACPYQVKRIYRGDTTSLTGASGQNLGTSPYNFTISDYGKYVLFVNGEATDCIVSLSMNVPGFACPVSTDVTVGQSVAFVLGSVTGCSENEEDCSYVVEGTSSYGSAYKNGALNSFTDASVTSATTKAYTVILTNEAGSTSHDCSVKYDAGNTGGGNATCAVSKDSVMAGEQNLVLSVSGMNPAPTSDIQIPMICDGKTLTTPTCRTGGSCDNVNFTAPTTPGKYICTFEKNGYNPCATLPTFVVAPPVSCSVTAETVSAGTQITFSGTANTKWGAQANSCGFKINGTWRNGNQNQNFTTGTMTYTVNATTTFSIVCTQGQAPESARVCTKTVTVY